MGKNSFRWQENPDNNENLNTIIGKLLSNSEMSFNLDETKSPYYENINITKVYDKNQNYTIKEENINYNVFKSSPDSCVKCYTMFLPFLLIKIDVFS
ncbi:hypothetical protein K4V01_11555, partial [Staphylococcus epidermidis]|nr:hypothetical protein [Staphylococcus epidermidis]